jgi:Sensors of blue-light using FAD
MSTGLGIAMVSPARVRRLPGLHLFGPRLCGDEDCQPVNGSRRSGAGRPMLERIVYVSRATPGTRLEAVFGIIRQAHSANAKAGLSGALIFLDGGFAQVLEGPRAPLAAAFARIALDRRHEAVELRARERALCRLFQGQAMALRTRACLDLALLEGFGYRPGFPVERFPADVLVEFAVRACRWTRGGRVS